MGALKRKRDGVMQRIWTNERPGWLRIASRSSTDERQLFTMFSVCSEGHFSTPLSEVILLFVTFKASRRGSLSRLSMVSRLLSCRYLLIVFQKE